MIKSTSKIKYKLKKKNQWYHSIAQNHKKLQ